jgi:lysophospholipase L1-like esterase
MAKLARRGALAVLIALSTCAVLVGTRGAAPAAGAISRSYYLSLGDSNAQGYQPGFSGGVETLHGFSNRVVTDVDKKYHLTLENYGCGGATSNSVLYTNGCRPGGLANNGVAYPNEPQSVAAIDFIKAHEGHIGLITLSIGWNDFGSCVGMGDPSSCVGPTLPLMQSNLTLLASRLREAAGAKTPILAMTYIDPDLADWLQGASGKTAASQWITELRSRVNPAIVRAFTSANIAVLDMTKAYGTYVAWSHTVTIPTYGKVPYAVAQVCEDTYMCKERDEETNYKGYAVIATQVARWLLARHRSVLPVNGANLTRG